ncbi:class I SAM-dependent methyltransferase family protein [Candidatus Woesearchaeota archaeon]|jgi:tRNA (guanine37-N1)-methyltransferase|nr:class I SAM-dependent methyltransferase family protein [Candidatus Woesearchaeota archaeon]MBT7062388.1 class I SAM-dependent methyltransferase family protein [Candidatus Woesearchaeota archaeon]
MVRCFKTKKENTQELKKFLRSKSWFNDQFKIGHSGKYVLLPIIDKAKQKDIVNKFIGTIEERNLIKIDDKKVENLRDALKKVIPADKVESINRGFEVVGDIAVLEVPEEIVPLEKSIAWTLKRMKPSINIVAKKANKTNGKYRIRKIKVLVGENRTETIHKESGVKIKTDLNKAYFSARLGTERLRVLKLIKPKENVLVVFAGVGPYPLVIAKHKPLSKITAIEWNPAAVRFFKENLKLNKFENRINIVKGDAHIEIPNLNEKFNRIIMVLPGESHKFLKETLNVAKKGAVIHLYQFEHVDKVKERGAEIKQMIEKLGRKVKSIKGVRSGYFAPKINRYSYDILLE